MAQRFTAKIFTNGGSQALRLPKECRMPGDEVVVTRDGARLIIEAIEPRTWSADLLALLDGPPILDFPERDQPPTQERPELEGW